MTIRAIRSTLRSRNVFDRKRSPGKLLVSSFLACFVSAMSGNVATAQEGRDLAELYGFLPVEIYKLENRISNLVLADIDGDGSKDVIVSNNGRSRFDILFSDPKIEPDKAETEKGVNTPEYDKRMRSRRYPVSKEIVSLVAADFNGDGKTDIAYYGRPAGVVILLNEGRGRFATPQIRDLGEAVSAQTSLTAGDLDRDGRADLVLLRDTEIVVLKQTQDGKLGDPIRLGHSAQRPRMLKVVDIDGDGGEDLIVLGSTDDQPVHVRLSRGKEEGAPAKEFLALGPERRLKLDQIRAIGFADLDGKPGQEWMVVDNATGRGNLLRLTASATSKEAAADDSDKLAGIGAIFDYPLPSTEGRGRSIDTGDLDGDGMAEVVVSDPEAAQVITFRRPQASAESFETVRLSPSLIGVRSIRVGDLDGDGRAEVYMLSEKEKQIGRGLWKDGRISFPSPLPIAGGEPIAFELADFDGDGKQELVYAVKSKVDGKDRIQLHALKCDAKGQFSASAWPGGVADVTLRDSGSSPERIQAIDVNSDGAEDLLLTGPYGNPGVILSRKAAAPLELSNLGPLATADRTSARMVMLDGRKVLMVTQNNFARVIALDSENRWQILDQFNASGASASIRGVATLNLDGNRQSDLVLYDQNSRELEVLMRDDNGTRSLGKIPMGNFDFQGLRSGNFGGDGRPDLLVEGGGRFSVLVTGARNYSIDKLGSYETTERRSRLGDVIAADFGGSAGPDVAWIDIGEHSVHITQPVVVSGTEIDLKPAGHFKVFEEKSFRDVRSLGEPRDVAAGDVDRDGLDDLVLIAHDRILVYRQDPGPASKPEGGSPAAAEPNGNGDRKPVGASR
ncbi:VCBS repeat-containing protein [bacterium]|nr:VCBS repeat-containing protein [bacterium]